MILAMAFLLAHPAWAQVSVRPDTAQVISRHTLENGHLTESSALVASRSQPGVLWTLNDSGNPPELFATDTAGHDLGAFRVEGADNRDWESMGYAKCGTRMCLYVGDTGDNQSRYPAVQIYRVPEPTIRSSTSARKLRPTGVLTVTYPDGPRDVEAMFVSPASDVYLISKGRTQGVRVYRIPATAWTSPVSKTVAQTVQELAIPDGHERSDQVTDASLANDGIHVAIRTYGSVYFFLLRDEHLVVDPERKTCDARVYIQGEGIAWLPGGLLVTTSEQTAMVGKTITVMRCFH
jgi:hypothetical protein